MATTAQTSVPGIAGQNLPLSGITVISCEQAVAAQFASRQLADLGARVIKIERPEVGDFARGYDTTVNGLSSHFVWINRNKESLALDLKSADGLKILHELRSEEHTSELQSRFDLVCRLLLEKKNKTH